MIDVDYVREMADYNTWQNKQITDIVELMPDREVKLDRKAFFGSIFSTLNHLLWGDTIWMSRFDPAIQAPVASIETSVSITATVGDWSAARFRLDGKIRNWAETLNNVDLAGDLTWYSGATGKTQKRPLRTCVVHFFNHQTHHRGQIHAMLTQAGAAAPVSDLVFMREE